MNLVIAFTDGGAYVLMHLFALRACACYRLHSRSSMLHPHSMGSEFIEEVCIDLTARFLFLFALVGNSCPAALAATAALACLLPSAREFITARIRRARTPSNPYIHDASCCNGDCCRAVTTAQWAHAQSKRQPFFLRPRMSGLAGQSTPVSHNRLSPIPIHSRPARLLKLLQLDINFVLA